MSWRMSIRSGVTPRAPNADATVARNSVFTAPSATITSLEPGTRHRRSDHVCFMVSVTFAQLLNDPNVMWPARHAGKGPGSGAS